MVECYKVVRRLEDGRLVSEFASGYSGFPQLDYQFGETTFSPDDAGIFCYRELKSAKISANFHSNPYVGVTVHVAYPVGAEVPFWGEIMPELVNYPAIKLGRKVFTIV